MPSAIYTKQEKDKSPSLSKSKTAMGEERDARYEYLSSLSAAADELNNKDDYERALAEVIGNSMDGIETVDELNQEETRNNDYYLSSSHLQPASEKQINELKKELKKIGNKRAIAIASKLSTGSEVQDEDLKQCEKIIVKIDIELNRLSKTRNTISSKANTKKGDSATSGGGVSNIPKNGSSVLIEDGNTTYPMDILKEKQFT